jgi:hypothetical protein
VRKRYDANPAAYHRGSVLTERRLSQEGGGDRDGPGPRHRLWDGLELQLVEMDAD